MTDICSPRRLNLLSKVFSFTLFLVFFSGCFSVKAECVKREGEKYNLQDIEAHVLEVLEGEEFLGRWGVDIQYGVLGFSDESLRFDLAEYAQEFSELSGVIVKESESPENINAYLIFADSIRQAYDSSLVESIYKKKLGYTQVKFEERKRQVNTAKGNLVRFLFSGEKNEYVYYFSIVGFDDYTRDKIRRYFLRSLYYSMTDFSQSDKIKPSITNVLSASDYPVKINKFDQLLLQSFYMKNVGAGEPVLSAAKKMACHIYSNL